MKKYERNLERANFLRSLERNLERANLMHT